MKTWRKIIVDGNTKVIWFNHWFSAIINTINSIKQAFPDIKIIGSNRSADCVYAYAVDEFYIEPSDASGDEYNQFVLNFCKEHNVDIMFVKSHSNDVANIIEELAQAGTTVICERKPLREMFESKHNVYSRLSRHGYKYIPNYFITDSVDGFKDAFKNIDKNGLVCIKYDNDEGAGSFRVVTDSFLTTKHFDEPSMNILSYDNAVKILELAERDNKYKEMLVMPYLSGPEVSVDCYMSKTKGFIALPRYKLGGRIKEIKLEQRLIDDCVEIQNIFGMHYIYNVQYRWDKDGSPRLLEINPRISGGMHLTSMCGFNLVIELIADILGIESNQSITNIKPCKVTQYETPVIIK